jgi:hypothetical protein
MEYACTAERFAHDVREHQMTVLRAAGIDRHLNFRKPGTGCFGFDVITWPGALCIHGDCGTYVFERVPDMFTFFRNRAADINPSYWAQKCVSADRNGLTQFEWESFTAAVERYVEDEDEDVRAEVLHDLAFIEPDEFGAAGFIRDYELGDFRFTDWEADCRSYTFHFIWCLRAIVWAIQKWDAAQQEAA